MARLRSVAPRVEKWIAIIDCSIDIGANKALVVLRVNLNAQASQAKALTLEDCECIGVKIKNIWNGELVAEALEEVFKTTGAPVAILKDDGGDLRKGVRLWSESQCQPVFQINDIGHFSANALKAEYNHQRKFKEMLSLVTTLSAQLKHSALGYLHAPSFGSHNRFFRIFKIAQWCEKLVALKEKNQIPLYKVNKRIRGRFKDMIKLKSFFKRFAKSCNTTVSALEILKNQGLNQKTHDQIQLLVKTLPRSSIVRKRLLDWLDTHLLIQKNLCMSDMPLPVSSDIIESLMGQFKTIIKRCPGGEFNRMILAFPNLCGDLNENNIMEALRHVKHKHLKEWEQEYAPETLRKVRRNFFSLNESTE